jgi:hypothetical protein
MSSQHVVVRFRDALRPESLPLALVVVLSYQSLNYIPHQRSDPTDPGEVSAPSTKQLHEGFAERSSSRLKDLSALQSVALTRELRDCLTELADCR